MSLELQRGAVLGKYELLVRIGRGGMASVWVARGRPNPDAPDQLVAIKAMLPDLAENAEFRSMFLDEGQIVGSIDHPNVVKIFEVAETEGVLFLVMEWVEGDSLHALIAEANKRRPIPPEVAVRMIADTASGLHAAHELRGWNGELQGVVHCDVSPHNILIGLDGGVKLVDFGVAAAMNRLNDEDEAMIRGKFGYMSPEQAQAKLLDRRSDLFSLGIVLFELTTGYRLFRGRDDRHTLDLVTWGKIPRPSQVVSKYPPKLEQIVMKALDRDIDQRFQTADELRTALEGYLVEERILVPSAGVKGLLKRVLGARIDQRREQVRTAIRSLDGSAPGAQLVSEGSVSDTSAAEEEEISVSVDRLSTSGELSPVSGVGAARLPTDSIAGAHSLSQYSAPQRRRRRSSGFWVGTFVGVLGAGGAMIVLSKETPPTSAGAVTARSNPPGAPAEHRAASTGRQPPAPIEDPAEPKEEKRGFSIDSLPTEPAPMQPRMPRVPVAKGQSPPLPNASVKPKGDAKPKVVLETEPESLPEKEDPPAPQKDRVAKVAESVTLIEESTTDRVPSAPPATSEEGDESAKTRP